LRLIDDIIDDTLDDTINDFWIASGCALAMTKGGERKGGGLAFFAYIVAFFAVKILFNSKIL
jgi:hypothetical protein